MNRGTKFIPLPFLLIVYGLLAIPAYAYVDPNTTSLLSQILTPVLIVAATGLTFLRKQVGSAIRWMAGRRPPKSD
jgi:hypothetical protein